MDHHCPWIGNCVGYHNYKPFFLFCFYQALTGISFIIISIDRGYITSENKPDLTFLGSFCFWFTTIVDLVISTSLLGLVSKHFINVYQNLTILEATGRYGNYQKKYPCLNSNNNNEK
jgi:palmitoyltransferase